MPKAIVLGLDVTGLGTVRGLADGGVDVYGLLLSPINSPGKFSKLCQVINLVHLHDNSELLCLWLYDFAKKCDDKPVVIPTSDVYALMLAENRDKLSTVCRFWSNSYTDIHKIISKDLLYEISSEAGVPVPPYLIDFSEDSIAEWCLRNPPPYILKPYYHGSARNSLGDKNKVFARKEEFVEYANATDCSGLIAMRILKGGDGHIYDCYGLCDANGDIVTLASHLRIRQYKPDFGTTCFGEIPSSPDAVDENKLFELTELLLSKMNYHGIFGIEWLQDKITKELYMLDFNARPFSSISHLNDCGLNLSFHAYRELCGLDISKIPYKPKLKHLYWLDFNRDLMSFLLSRRGGGELGLYGWFKSIARSRSFACWRLKDPGPSFCRFLGLFSSRNLMKFLGR
jgi:predicted ATP-grasp superfamily ATP-dependent carboligase